MSYVRLSPSYQGADLTEENVTDQINSVIEIHQSLTRHVSKLRRIVNKIGSKHDTPEFRVKLRDLEQGCKSETKKLMKRMKAIHQTTGLSDVHIKRVTKLQHEIASSIDEMSELFSQIETKQGDIIRIMDEKERRDNIDITTTTEQEEGLLPKRTQADLQFLEFNANEMEQRRANILQIESDALEILEMHKELQTMVYAQAENVTKIEDIIEHSKEEVNVGFEELEVAEEHMASARRKKICLVSTIIILVSLFLLLMFWDTSSD